MTTSNHQRGSSGVLPTPDFLEVLRSFLSDQDDPLSPTILPPPTHQFYVEFPTHPELLRNTLNWFETLDLSFIPHRLGIECKTMLGEAVDNVRDHAHQGVPKATLIPIVIYCFPNLISIQVWDQGPGFNLIAHLQSKENWTQSRESRGRGLKILEELSDRMGYLTDLPRGNCLIMVKTLQPKSE